MMTATNTPTTSPRKTAALLQRANRHFRDCLARSNEGQAKLAALGVTDPDVIDHFELGYADDTFAKTLPPEEVELLREIGFINRTNCTPVKGAITIPAFIVNNEGEQVVVDFHGLRRYGSTQLRSQNWKVPSEGIIGAQWLAQPCEQIILTDAMLHALQARAHGYQQIASIRSADEFQSHADAGLFDKVGTVYLVSRQRRNVIVPALEQRGVRVVIVRTPNAEAKIPRHCFEEVFNPNASSSDMRSYRIRDLRPKSRKRSRKAAETNAPKQAEETQGADAPQPDNQRSIVAASASPKLTTSPTVSATEVPSTDTTPAVNTEDVSTVAPTNPLASLLPIVELIERRDSVLIFRGAGLRYQVDSHASTGLNLRVKLRVEAPSGLSVLDTVQLLSSRSRSNTAKAIGARLAFPAATIENHLGAIADQIDAMITEDSERNQRIGDVSAVRDSRKLSKQEQDDALERLREGDVLGQLDAALAEAGVVGEEQNRKLGILAAVSYKAEQGAMLDLLGPAGTGKTTLLHGVSRLLPSEDVVRLTQLSEKSLLYLNRDQLWRKSIFIEEFAGAESAAYPLRAIYSSGHVSTAVTTRVGSTPTTTVVNTPARVSVLFSGTQPVDDAELRSRLIELHTDTSDQQTQAVMSAPTPRGTGEIIRAANMIRMLRPCRVEIPFAHRIQLLASGATSGGGGHQLRREKEKMLRLVAASAMLNQHKRETREIPGQDELVVEAEIEDYEAVHELAGAFLRPQEPEGLSSVAARILAGMRDHGLTTFTRQQVIETLTMPYTSVWRGLKELMRYELLAVDSRRNGVTHHFTLVPNGLDGCNALTLTPPPAVGT